MMNEQMRKQGSAWIASGLIVLSAAVTGHAFDRQATVVRDAAGPCAVIDDSTGPLAVSVRVPSSPAAEGLAKLPEHQRDFSSLPARIVLQSPPDSGAATDSMGPTVSVAATDVVPD